MYRSSKEYQPADDVRKVAEQVIQDKNLDFNMCSIEYVKVYPNISKTKIGECRVLNRREHYFSGADYLISMSGDIWDELDADRRYILTWHELMHIYPQYNEKKGEWNYKVRNHDVEDFAEIIKEHGVDWFGEVKDILMSFHDMDPDKKSKIRI